jgi:hypothetical protein
MRRDGVARAARQLAQAPRRWLRGLWRLLGSRQCRQGGLAMGVACLVLIAYELGAVRQALETIAQAQAISGYAVLRQLQGRGPGLAGAARGPGAALVAPAGIAAIDPRLLGVAGADGPAPSSRALAQGP